MGIDLDFDASGLIEDVADMIVNGGKISLVPTVGICANASESSVVHVSGGIDLYAFAIGSVTRRQKATARVKVCETYVIHSEHHATLELPVRLAASAFAAESFGAPKETFAKVSAELSGSVTGPAVAGGSIALGGGSLAVESETVIPNEDSVDFAETVTLQVIPGENRVTAAVAGSFEVLVQARGGGLFGSVSGSATGGIDLPGSFEVGFITGPGGSALPPGIRIVSAVTGITHADTTAAVGHQPRLAIGLVSGVPVLSWNSHRDFAYRMEWHDGTAWHPFPETWVGSGATRLFIDRTSPLPGSRLYRLRYDPAPQQP
jgi:hypothetical protein